MFPGKIFKIDFSLCQGQTFSFQAENTAAVRDQTNVLIVSLRWFPELERVNHGYFQVRAEKRISSNSFAVINVENIVY